MTDRQWLTLVSVVLALVSAILIVQVITETQEPVKGFQRHEPAKVVDIQLPTI